MRKSCVQPSSLPVDNLGLKLGFSHSPHKTSRAPGQKFSVVPKLRTNSTHNEWAVVHGLDGAFTDSMGYLYPLYTEPMETITMYIK